MTEPEHEKRGPADLAGGIGVGALMLLISSFLTFCFVSGIQEGKNDLWFGPFAILLLAVVWSMTLGLFASCFSGRAVQGVSRILWKIADLGFVCFLLCLGLKSVVVPVEGEPQVARGGETFVVLLLGYCVVGVLLFLSARRSHPGGKPANLSSYDVSLMWPMLLLGRAPLIALLLFLVVGGLTYLGERVGASWGHALLGALCGASLIPCVLIGLVVSVGRANDGQESDDGPVE